MHTLLRLPIILLEMALRGGAGAVKDLLRAVAGGSGGERPYTPTPEAEAEATAAAGARRDAERVAAAEAAARRPAARPSAARRRTRSQARRPLAEAPAPGPEAELLGDTPAHVSRNAEPVASFGPSDDPSSTLDVQAPWPRYDEHTATEVVKRVRAGDEATRAVVLLYERSHKQRKSVIAAAEATPS
jgi:hypothetical protein